MTPMLESERHQLDRLLYKALAATRGVQPKLHATLRAAYEAVNDIPIIRPRERS